MEIRLQQRRKKICENENKIEKGLRVINEVETNDRATLHCEHIVSYMLEIIVYIS